MLFLSKFDEEMKESQIFKNYCHGETLLHEVSKSELINLFLNV